jgi:GNAT superfamily N-acetyltransferase
MKPDDLKGVHDLADAIHVDHPEDLAVLAERQALFPGGCHVLARHDALVGYVISHPWEFGRPPALNTMLERLPASPTTYYLHDLAIGPEARGLGSAGVAVDVLLHVAKTMGLENLSLIAVQASQRFWERFGFVPTSPPGMASKLASYGDAAVFMTREVDQRVSDREAGLGQAG